MKALCGAGCLGVYRKSRNNKVARHARRLLNLESRSRERCEAAKLIYAKS